LNGGNRPRTIEEKTTDDRPQTTAEAVNCDSLSGPVVPFLSPTSSVVYRLSSSLSIVHHSLDRKRGRRIL
jgi:hypothetical protein